MSNSPHDRLPVEVIDLSFPKPSSQVTPLPINTEATSITTTLPEITLFITLQLRVGKLEQDMSEVKKTDHSATVLDSIKSQVPTKYSMLPGPGSIKNQESKKSPKEIIRIKREQGEEKQESMYTIRPALMEVLIADEDAMDKEVKDRVKDHKRKHGWRRLIKMMMMMRRPFQLDQTRNNWANAHATSYQVPAENKLQRKTYDIGEIATYVKAIHKNKRLSSFQMDECHSRAATNKVDLVNPEGHQIVRNIYEPLPLGGPLGQRKLMRLNEIHKFSDGTLTRVMEKLDHMVKDFHLYEYNKGMKTRKWSEDDKRRSKDFITAIEKRLQIRRIFRSLESFVGGRIRHIDYRLINRTT
ncbi:hypothetical protein Tco_0385795 [Tanacetum coccineum]